MAGPISRVNTTVASIDLDISRKLNWGKGITLKFLVPDPTDVVTGLQTVKTLTKGFDRISEEEASLGDGKTVVYQVADKAGELEDILRTKDLHVEADGLLTQVASVSAIGPNEATVYTLTCNIRTLKKTYFR